MGKSEDLISVNNGRANKRYDLNEQQISKYNNPANGLFENIVQLLFETPYFIVW